MTLPKTILDVLSPTESKELLTRLKVLSLLHKKVTYRQITKKTGAGAATIARISKRINDCTGGIYDANQKTIKTTRQNYYSFGSTVSEA